MPKTFERFGLDLPHVFACYSQLLTDLFESMRFPIFKAETKAHHVTLLGLEQIDGSAYVRNEIPFDDWAFRIHPSCAGCAVAVMSDRSVIVWIIEASRPDPDVKKELHELRGPTEMLR